MYSAITKGLSAVRAKYSWVGWSGQSIGSVGWVSRSAKEVNQDVTVFVCFSELNGCTSRAYNLLADLKFNLSENPTFLFTYT